MPQNKIPRMVMPYINIWLGHIWNIVYNSLKEAGQGPTLSRDWSNFSAW